MNHYLLTELLLSVYKYNPAYLHHSFEYQQQKGNKRGERQNRSNFKSHTNFETKIGQYEQSYRVYFGQPCKNFSRADKERKGNLAHGITLCQRGFRKLDRKKKYSLELDGKRK